MKRGNLHKLRWLRDRWAFFNVFWGRGRGMFVSIEGIWDLAVKIAMSAFLIEHFIGITLTPLLMGILAVGGSFFFIGVAWLDRFKFHLWQKEQEISTEVNPIIMRMSKRIRGISKNTRNRVIFH